MAHDHLRSCILSAMRGRSVLEIGVAVAAALSVGLLAVMLASPWLPQATDASLPPAFEPTAEPTPDGEQPPIGLYLLRGAFSFGPCLAIELGAESHPIAEDAEGSATVLWWQRGMTGCDARTGDIEEINASVTRVLAEDDGHLIGYALDFRLPLDLESEQTVASQITILAGQSTDELLQALDTSAGSSGFGLVLDRVPDVDPTLNPLPSAAPQAFQPTGLYLLEGPLDSNGSCLVLELDASSYPADLASQGTATIRWWERAVADPGNPAECLRRTGDIHEANATVVSVPGNDPGAMPVAYAISFAMAAGAPRPVEITIDLDDSTLDQLHGRLVAPAGGGELIFDRVDSIDPPLGPAPSASPGG